MKLFRICLALAAAAASLAKAATGVATTSVFCQSPQLLPSAPFTVFGIGSEVSYYSTFNGVSGAFLEQITPTALVSGELRPRAGSPGVYEGGYANATALTITDYGSYIVNVPTTDTTGVGVPDVFNYTKPGTFAASGTAYDTTNGGLPFSVQINFNRTAGSATGTYTTTSVNIFGVTTVVTGNFNILDYLGTIRYVRGATNTLTLTLLDQTDGIYTITGTTTYTVASNGQVNYASFNAVGSTGLTYSILAGSLVRTGNTYLGQLQVVNGLPNFFYPAFVNNQFQIVDTNNTSGDGIPDFSDPALANSNVPPSFTLQPTSVTVVSGTTAVFSCAATGSPPPTYQWKLNGVNLSGATNPRLVISGATPANAGAYTCTATNSFGSATTTPQTLNFTATNNIGRLVNLSVLTTAGKSQVLTVGFVSGGAGTSGNENLLIRATGPALAALGVTGTLADPTLTLLNGQAAVASNDNWASSSANQAAVTAADAATFAFALTNPLSLDAALAQAVPAAAYTAQVSGNTATSGTALAEVYDNTPAVSYNPSIPRLINLSAKNQIVAGGSMTAGFVVGGITSKTVLIRATGPALAILGVTGVLPDPKLTLHTTVNSQDVVLATNAGWGGDPQITAASNSVFAFPLTNAASADSVVLVTLAPGAYTAVASSVSGAAGTVLIEVYEVP